MVQAANAAGRLWSVMSIDIKKSPVTARNRVVGVSSIISSAFIDLRLFSSAKDPIEYPPIEQNRFFREELEL